MFRRVGFAVLCVICTCAFGCVHTPPLYQRPPGFSSSYQRYLLEQQSVRMQPPLEPAMEAPHEQYGNATGNRGGW